MTLAGNVAWNIGTAFGSDFVGGEATLTYKLDGGPEITFPFEIQGLNPTQATVRAELASLRHHLIAWKEGRFQQFQTLADFTAFWTQGPLSVLRSGDNGFGIMQLTSGTIPKNELWNWKDNANEGESRADAFTASALIYNDQVQQGLPWDSNTGHQGTGPPNEGIAFPDAPEFTQDELDLETWARYNSGLRYHDWTETATPGVFEWKRRVPEGAGAGLTYADDLQAFRDDIINNSVFPPLWD